MGFCSKFVKPALRQLRREITERVLGEAATLIGAVQPLVADGRISKPDAEAIAVAFVKSKQQISTTGAMLAVNLAHEMLTKAGATVADMQAAAAAPDTQGATEIDGVLGGGGGGGSSTPGGVQA